MSLSSLIRHSVSYSKSFVSVTVEGIHFFTQRKYSTVVSQESSTLRNDAPISMENPFVKEKQQCILCKMKIRPDYKNPKLLSQFVSPYTGRTYGRHITRLCKAKQAQVEKEIEKSQNAGLMPYYHKDSVFLGDPKLFNPEKPIRNHDYY